MPKLDPLNNTSIILYDTLKNIYYILLYYIFTNSNSYKYKKHNQKQTVREAALFQLMDIFDRDLEQVDKLHRWGRAKSAGQEVRQGSRKYEPCVVLKIKGVTQIIVNFNISHLGLRAKLTNAIGSYVMDTWLIFPSDLPIFLNCYSNYVIFGSRC